MKKFLVASLIALMAGTAYAATDEAKENAVSTDATAATAEKQPEAMSLAKLKLGGKEITVMIAETEEQRKQGLMNVERMDENNGMIFSYGAPVEKACMWMKDTKIPLDVAFINGEGKIVNIEADMKPLSTDSHCNTAGPIYYALEMNAGWFAKNGVKPGDSLSNE